jgi:hypothetical protein
MMDQPQLIGLATIGLAMLLVCWVLFRRRRAILLIALLICALGLGYLASTPVPTQVARAVFGQTY